MEYNESPNMCGICNDSKLTSVINTIQTPELPPELVNHSEQYEALLELIHQNYKTNVGSVNTKRETLYVVSDTKSLFNIFLSNLPEPLQQHYNCNTCRSFFKRYGGIVEIDKTTFLKHSVVWPTDPNVIPSIFTKAIIAVNEKVIGSDIRCMFNEVSGYHQDIEFVYGESEKGGFNHISIPFTFLFNVNNKITSQKVITLRYAIESYKPEVIECAIGTLKAIADTHSEIPTFIKNLELFQECQKNYDKSKDNRVKANILWYYANKSITICSMRSNIVGSLMDDIQSENFSLATCVERFKPKLHPLKYRRPQAPPKAGNVAVAEKIIAELGLEDSLKREFAVFEDIYLMWKPSKEEAPKSEGVFGHLKTSNKKEEPKVLEAPPEKITLEDFMKLLPTFKKMECVIRPNDQFCCFTNATIKDSKPILKYDKLDNRNTISQFGIHESTPVHWNVAPNTYAEVIGITTHPGMRDEEVKLLIVFLLPNCYPKPYRNGLGLFPVEMIPELYQIRSTIEEFSNSGSLGDPSVATAGVCHSVQKFEKQPVRIRVNGNKEYIVYI